MRSFIKKFSETWDGIAVGRLGRMIKQFDDASLHVFTHHVFPAAGFVVDELPLQANDVAEQTLGEAVLAKLGLRLPAPMLEAARRQGTYPLGLALAQVVRSMVGERFDFERATTLREALDRVSRERFDVVILDIGLPDGSGWGLLPDIRARQPDASIVILSGADTTAEEARRVEAVLLKSQVSPKDLIDALGSRIRSSRPRRSKA